MATNNLFLTLFVKIKVAFANVQCIVIKKGANCMIKQIVTEITM